VTDAAHRKALLLARIEAHRTIADLEVRCARATFDPWGSVLSVLGVDGAATTAVASTVRSLLGARTDGHHPGAMLPLLVAALLPLVGQLGRGHQGASEGGEPSTA